MLTEAPSVTLTYQRIFLLTEIFSGLELGAQGHLVVPSANDLWKTNAVIIITAGLPRLAPAESSSCLKGVLSLQCHQEFAQWIFFFALKTKLLCLRIRTTVVSCMCTCASVVTHQRAEAGACQRHGEGRHGNRAKVEDSRIDVEGGEGLNRSRNSRLQWIQFKLHHRADVVSFFVALKRNLLCDRAKGRRSWEV